MKSELKVDNLSYFFNNDFIREKTNFTIILLESFQHPKSDF